MYDVFLNLTWLSEAPKNVVHYSSKKGIHIKCDTNDIRDVDARIQEEVEKVACDYNLPVESRILAEYQYSGVIKTASGKMQHKGNNEIAFVVPVSKCLYFLPPMIGDFFCTDNDSSQYLRKIDWHTYQCVEVRSSYDGKNNKAYRVVAATIDLAEYSAEQLLENLDSYYSSLDAMMAEYKSNSFQIMAEIVFENGEGNETEIGVYDTRGDAEAHVFCFACDPDLYSQEKPV